MSLFGEGQRVTLVGLSVRADLNDSAATILSWSSSRKRYAVKVAGEGDVMVKPENLISARGTKASDEDEDEDKDENEDIDEETYPDSDEEFENEKLKKYVAGFHAFLEHKEMWRQLISTVSELPYKTTDDVHKRAQLVLYEDGYETLLYGLHKRPKGLRMHRLFGSDELKTFCEAIVIGWMLWPDSWTGLQMMLDYLAESVVTADLARLTGEHGFLSVVKEIAQTKNWPNNQIFGPMMTGAAAKTLLARITRSAGFAEATTISIARCMGGLGFEPCQPDRGDIGGSHSSIDRRRVCDNPDCFNVESDETKFSKCARCKKVAYCSKECQRYHWVIHKRACEK